MGHCDKTSYEEIKLDFEVNAREERYNETKENKNTEEVEEVPVEKEYRIKKMEPRGIVYSTYIIAENEDGMYIIDQHAAAERINYEKVLAALKKKIVIVDLLIPVKIELSASEALIIKENFSLLEEYGFKTEEFGINTIIVKSHPTWLITGYEEEQIRKINEVYDYENKLLERKENVIKLIDEKGLLTDELKNKIMASEKLVEVEDLYRPFKCKKTTKRHILKRKAMCAGEAFAPSAPKCINKFLNLLQIYFILFEYAISQWYN